MAVLTACSAEQNRQPMQHIVMPVSICLPMNEVYATHRAPSPRRIGDPGTTEQFKLPNYVYFIILRQNGANWELWRTIEQTLTNEDWLPTHYTGDLKTYGDSVYIYTEHFNLLLSNQKFNGRIYAIASAVPLTLSQSISSISNLSETLNLTFDASSSTVQQNLQHIYSSPNNYEIAGEYYGSFSSVTHRVPHVSLMLYHVASKVDITWHVDEEVRIKANPAEAVRLTYLGVRRLYNGQAYCFKPMKNEVDELPESGYDIPNIVTATDEGLWWEGRTYFYTIPYYIEGEPEYFPLQMVLCTNGAEQEDGYKLTLNQPMDTSSVFVPWLRGNFNLTMPLENKSEIKTIDS